MRRIPHMTATSQPRHAAGATDEAYADQISQIARQILKLIGPEHRLQMPDAKSDRHLSYDRYMRGYDVSSAFPNQIPMQLVLCDPKMIKGAMGGLKESFLGKPTIFISIEPYFLANADYDWQNAPDGFFVQHFTAGYNTWTSLLHEISHAVRHYVQGVKSQNTQQKTVMPNMNAQNQFDAYHRTPPEIDAFFMQGLADMWDRYRQYTEGATPEKAQKIKRLLFGDDPAGMIRRMQMNPGMQQVWREVPEDVRRRWIKRATQFWNHLNTPTKTAGRKAQILYAMLDNPYAFQLTQQGASFTEYSFKEPDRTKRVVRIQTDQARLLAQVMLTTAKGSTKATPVVNPPRTIATLVAVVKHDIAEHHYPALIFQGASASHERLYATIVKKLGYGSNTIKTLSGHTVIILDPARIDEVRHYLNLIGMIR